ncbi:hypothetical protein F444_16249 [Phytophthora nicotianae P1976]|uniref:Uncharacterized protein n=1 Tax=Phytophthora nicotianae P1976 TaxID=1317066 RepID=A0A080ZJ66_PHYNI|nr:hypothetical protein F444_16249 [Phytophthora nicotianae P1976]
MQMQAVDDRRLALKERDKARHLVLPIPPCTT